MSSNMTGIAMAIGLGLLGIVTSGAAAEKKKGVHVCVGADAILRFRPEPECAGGAKSFLLAEVEEDLTPDDEDTTKKEIAALERRIRTLEGGPGVKKPGQNSATQVSAPFEVVDRSGHAILRVTDASLDDEPKAGARVLLARGGANNYSLFFKNASGVDMSGIGQTKEGAGGLYVSNADGTLRASMLGTEGVVVFNRAGLGVAKLGSLASGNGYLTIGDPAGNSMVEAGVSEGRGLVRAYPTTGISPVPVPFFIRGGVWKK